MFQDPSNYPQHESATGVREAVNARISTTAISFADALKLVTMTTGGGDMQLEGPRAILVTQRSSDLFPPFYLPVRLLKILLW